MSAGHLCRQFRLAYGESPYAYLMTRRIERMATNGCERRRCVPLWERIQWLSASPILG
jgi:hypothetical protein